MLTSDKLSKRCETVMDSIMLEKRRLTLKEGFELSSDENEENDMQLLKDLKVQSGRTGHTKRFKKTIKQNI